MMTRDPVAQCCLNCTAPRCYGDCQRVRDVEMQAEIERAAAMGAEFEMKRNGMKFYIMDGRRLTLTGWAKTANLPYSTLKQRLDNGMTLRDALRKPAERGGDFGLYEIGGVKKTLREWSRECALSPATLRSRMHEGMTLEEAMREKRRKRRTAPKQISFGVPPKQYMVNGRRMTIKQAAEAAGMSVSGVKWRMHEYGMSVEDIVNGVPAPKREHTDTRTGRPATIYTVNGRSLTFKECMALGHIGANALRYRLKLGLSMEQALALGRIKPGTRIEDAVKDVKPTP